MTILIKGIKTPKTCQICRATGFDRIVDCSLWQHVRSISLDKHRNCPLIPVSTPHGRLGDLDKLYKHIKAECNIYGKPTIGFEDGNKVLKIIADTHTVIEAEEGK